MDDEGSAVCSISKFMVLQGRLIWSEHKYSQIFRQMRNWKQTYGQNKPQRMI